MFHSSVQRLRSFAVVTELEILNFKVLTNGGILAFTIAGITIHLLMVMVLLKKVLMLGQNAALDANEQGFVPVLEFEKPMLKKLFITKIEL